MSTAILSNMTASESSGDHEKEVVSVSKHGQATIPKRFREKLGIDAPGKVLFRETEAGTIIVEQVRSASAMQGFAASHVDGEQSGTQLLRRKRAQDRSERDTRVADNDGS